MVPFFYIYVFKFIFLPYLWQLKCLFYQHPSYVLSYCWLCFGLEEKKEKKNLYKLTNSESPFRTIFLEKRKKGKKKCFPQIQDRFLDCWRSRYARPDILAPPASLIYIKVSLNILWFCSSGGHRPQIHWRCTVRFPLSLRLSLCAQGHGWWTLHRTKATIRYMAQSVKKI